jgi:hypothetical protein
MITDPEIRHLRVLHLALVMGCVGFLGVAHYAGPVVAGDPSFPSEPFQIIGVVSLGLIAVSFTLFKSRVRQGFVGIAPLRSALIVHWALIELPCMLNLVFYLLTGSLLHAGAAIIALAILAFRAPTTDRLHGWSTGTFG